MIRTWEAHLNGITLISPVFHEAEIFGFPANIAHHVDVGGGAPGSTGVSSAIYQGGVAIPPATSNRGTWSARRHLEAEGVR